MNHCGNGVPSPPFSITVNHDPTANAGPDATICSGKPFTIVNASASNYSTLNWTSYGTGSLINDTTLTPTFIPASGEAGDVKLTLTVNGIPPCGFDTSFMTIQIQSKPKAFAGKDLMSCDSIPIIMDSSTASDYSFLVWRTSGTGTFNDPAILHPVYYPSETDVLNGQIVLTLKALITDSCPADSSSLKLVLARKVIVDAGADAFICQGQSYPITDASSNYFSTLLWTHNGIGNLTGANTLTPVYHSGNDESGDVLLTLKAFGLAGCKDNFTSS
jgi:hypothetical protein